MQHELKADLRLVITVNKTRFKCRAWPVSLDKVAYGKLHIPQINEQLNQTRLLYRPECFKTNVTVNK